MADQKEITLYPGAGSATDIVLRPLPVADVPSTTIWLSQGSGTATDIVLRNTTLQPGGGGATTWTYSGNGLFTLGGSAGITRGHAWAASGGLQLGGSAALAHGHAWQASGGLQIGGSAAWSRSIVPSVGGSLLIGGSALTAKGKSIVASGGLQLGGAAATSVQSAGGTQTWDYLPSGGLSIAGAALTQRQEYIHVVLGGGSGRRHRVMVRPPRATQIHAWAAQGGLHMGGSAAAEFTPSPARVFDFKPSGRLSLGGAAHTEHFDQLAAVLAEDEDWLLAA